MNLSKRATSEDNERITGIKSKARIEMNSAEITAWRQWLRQQSRELTRAENDLKIKKALLAIRDVYACRIDKGFDPVLSAKIDCIIWLLEI